MTIQIQDNSIRLTSEGTKHSILFNVLFFHIGNEQKKTITVTTAIQKMANNKYTEKNAFF